MSEPLRYLDGDRDSLGARLLASAEHDAPSARSLERALAAAAALGAGTLATSSASAGASSALVWLRWLGIGALAGGVTATGATALLDSPPPAAPAAVVAPPQPTVTAVSVPGSPPPAAVLPGVPSAAAPARASAVPVPSEEPPPASDGLGQELARIDSARRRQAAGDALGALKELDRYRQEFPKGRFTQEAALVRAEAMVSLGDCNGALRLAPASDAGVLARRWNALADRCR